MLVPQTSHRAYQRRMLKTACGADNSCMVCCVQTIEDLKKHPDPVGLPADPEKRARKLERLISKTALT